MVLQKFMKGVTKFHHVLLGLQCFREFTMFHFILHCFAKFPNNLQGIWSVKKRFNKSNKVVKHFLHVSFNREGFFKGLI